MITSYPRSACTLLHLFLFLALVSFWTSSHNPASPSPASPFPFFYSFPSFLAICPGLLNYQFTTVYVILFVPAWFVVYLTLSLLSDVVDRGGNETAFGFLDFPCLKCFRGHT